MSGSGDCKKKGLAALAAFILINILDFVLHGVLLKGVYMRPYYAGLWNPEAVMASRRWAMLLGDLLFAVAFAKIYAQGYEDSKPAVGQGLRFGLLAGLLPASFNLTQYMVYPISCKLAGAWAAGGVVECAILGAVVSLIYRPSPSAN